MTTAEDSSAPSTTVSGTSEAEDRWTALVAARGDEIATADEQEQLTYRQVDGLSAARTERLLSRVAQAASDPGAPVVILVGHDRRAVVAALASFRAGVPKVTLDATVPLPRLLEVVRSSGAEVGLVAPEFLELAGALGLRALVEVDVSPAALSEAQSRWPSGPTPAWEPRLPDGIQGISFTSGSSGTPKGVAVRWRTTPYDLGFRVQDDWCRAGEVVGLIMPLSFGAAQGELTSALLLGARVDFFDPRARGVGPLPDWIAAHEVAVLAAPPSLLTALARGQAEGETLPASLRMVRSSGEKVLCSEAVAIRRVLPPGCRFLNVFGSSEATLISSYEITDDTPDLPRPVPAGWVLPGREIRVEDEDGNEPPAGEAGELVVISSELPAGYWRDEVRTARRFLPLPDGRVALRTGDMAVRLPDGSFRLSGRKDLAVKIRGNLVEPAEVEVALLHCEGVQEAVVVGRPARSGHDRLVGYVVYRKDVIKFRSADLRRELLTRVPSYMVPEALVYLSELPRNERGKVDRAALPEPSRPVQDDPDEVLTPWQRQLAEIWAAVLELESVALKDDFFDLGGDSLAAAELVTRVAGACGVEVDSAVLVQAPTLEEFAAWAQSRQPEPHADGGVLVTLRASGSRTPLFVVPGAGVTALRAVPLARHLHPDQPVYALQAPARGRYALPDWFVRRTARRNIAVLRGVIGRGPCILAGHSFGGVIAFEMAHQLRASGQTVELLVTLDSFAPHPRELTPVRRRSAREWVRTLARFAKTTVGTTPPTPGDLQPHVQQSHAASLLYRGKPYPGRTLVVVAEDGGAGLVKQRGASWSRYLSGPWRVAATPGTHTTMLVDPHVAALAQAIEEEIRGS